MVGLVGLAAMELDKARAKKVKATYNGHWDQRTVKATGCGIASAIPVCILDLSDYFRQSIDRLSVTVKEIKCQFSLSGKKEKL
ncbi:hypothetical protein RRG08_060122 [Elysia crispata]|uniref:Uncharacterized protein n=1 Tax=Elysia crispata TaxID=231223 RepID=A0AAE1BBN4_9GAST|nr:hypothetical protein RRG08_060122 [Elysia crispata]